jgi:ABC-type Zn uptake system ZnuABC Zn-binding protein ZnuA
VRTLRWIAGVWLGLVCACFCAGMAQGQEAQHVRQARQIRHAERIQQAEPIRHAARIRQAQGVQPNPQGSSSAPARAADAVLVLTSLPATYSIASALAEGTRIRVVNVPVEGRPMSTQSRFFERPTREVENQLKRADAVITVGKLWREDPLYPAARAQNIRVVNIDATEPVSRTLTGVALMREPEERAPWERASGSPNAFSSSSTDTSSRSSTEASDPAAGSSSERADASGSTGASSRAAMAAAPSPARTSTFFWLSPSNAARAAEIVGADLARLSPPDAQAIAANLADYRRMLFDLKQSYEARLAELEDVTVFSLTPDFVYLTSDLGLLVDGYFLKQEIEWKPADFEAFTQHLKNRGIRVVIHKRDPGEAVRNAIASAGAKLVVLRTAETFSTEPPAPSREQSYIQDLEANLRTLYAALMN